MKKKRQNLHEKMKKNDKNGHKNEKNDKNIKVEMQNKPKYSIKANIRWWHIYLNKYVIQTCDISIKTEDKRLKINIKI